MRRSRARRDVERVADALLPGILKTARLGYDGKGQRPVADRAGLARRFAALGGVRLRAREAPAARRRDQRRRRPQRATATSSTCRCRTTSTSPASSPSRACRRGRRSPPRRRPRRSRCATRLAEALDYVGVLCVEFFVLADGSLVANEMAPRPHNSGHYSLDACDVSQFELQVRAMTGAPLAAPRLHSPCVMLNLLGDLWRGGQRARLARRARAARRPPAPVRQGRGAARPQDGPPHAHRGDRRRRGARADAARGSAWPSAGFARRPGDAVGLAAIWRCGSTASTPPRSIGPPR